MAKLSRQRSEGTFACRIVLFIVANNASGSQNTPAGTFGQMRACFLDVFLMWPCLHGNLGKKLDRFWIDFGSILDHFCIDLGSIWDRLGKKVQN